MRVFFATITSIMRNSTSFDRRNYQVIKGKKTPLNGVIYFTTV